LKKLTLVAVIFAFAALMVLPVVGSVKLPAGKLAPISPALTADGWPQPPLPPTGGNRTLVADGWPQPPLPPTGNGVLLADGWPQPPLPPTGGNRTLVADGWPQPPLPPTGGSYAIAVA
jgi:hypothetical protein